MFADPSPTYRSMPRARQAVNYPSSVLAPLVTSTRHFAPTALIVFLVRDANVSIQPFQEGVIFDRALGAVEPVIRFRWYASACTRAREPCLAIDTRDAFFQSPMPWPTPPVAIQLHAETNRANIGSCPHNSAWIRRNFGTKTLRAMENRRLSTAAHS